MVTVMLSTGYHGYSYAKYRLHGNSYAKYRLPCLQLC